MTNVPYIVMITAFGAGILGTMIASRPALARAFSAGCAVVGSGAALMLGIQTLLSGTPSDLLLPEWLAATGFAFHLDGLGAFFLLVIGLVGIAAAVYGHGYTSHYAGRYSLRLVGSLLNGLLLALCLQVAADNALTFLFCWEVMTVSAYLLVMTEHDRPGTVQAGIWYIAMSHAGFAALVAGFLLLGAGSVTASFADLRATSNDLSTLLRDAVFILALLGFGTKAGIVPLHVWLPMAHPVAPSHVSALMSGVVIKMGIFGLFRVVFDILGDGPVWWGGAVLAVGTISALLGVLYALMEHDLKRLLAYHSVENIGIILIGLGAGLVFRSYGLAELATLGFIGALFHTINHASFKGLLFLGAGSVLHATHTRNMEEMGGLIKRMPWTAVFFLLGSVAISALPPLNGFASEWVIFQSLLGGVNIPRPEIAAVMPLAVGILALTSGLAAACFVKAFGVTFLAIPRSDKAEDAHESPISMWLGMLLLALACVALGLAPHWVVPALGRVVDGFGGVQQSSINFNLNLSLTASPNETVISPALIAAGLLVLLAVPPLVFWVLRINRRPSFGPSWGCGRIGQTARMEYTATSFAEPLKRIFAAIYRPAKKLSIDFHPESKYFVESIKFRSEITPWFEKTLYFPFLALIGKLSATIRRLQSGSVHLYLAYVSVALLILLLIARWY